jgi:hypothetical protein
MRPVLVIWLLCAAACGEKRNPDRCCVSEADCAAIGLPNGSSCPPGELCRGNECVEQTCSMSSQCDLAAPYCEDSHCAEMCESDASCPGAEQTNKPYCVSGACTQCRDTSDCSDQVCVNGSCTGCATDGECASGVCVIATGLCASTTDVAFVSATGSPTSNCTKADPCTLLRALAVDPPRATIKLAAGTYLNATTLTIEGKRSLSGEGPDQTRITNSGNGPIFVLGTNSDVSFDRLDVFGAKNGAELGAGVRCAGNMKLRMTDVRLRSNASDGLFGNCDVRVSRVTFSENSGRGALLRGEAFGGGTNYLVDRAMISGNIGTGLELEGAGTVRNTFIVRNMGAGLLVSGYGASRPQVEFVTIADNAQAAICNLNDNAPTATLTNIIVVRNLFTNPGIGGNLRSCTISSCRSTSGIEPGCTLTQLGLLRFVSSETAPFDYHIGEGSVAIDEGSGGVGLVDFDGDPRPKGAASDLGADEAF